jgi:hypothetical protein
LEITVKNILNYFHPQPTSLCYGDFAEGKLKIQIIQLLGVTKPAISLSPIKSPLIQRITENLSCPNKVSQQKLLASLQKCAKNT